jgi:hypothetical protein
MNRKTLIFLFTFFALFCIGFNLHAFYLEKIGVELPFNLEQIYLFHAGFSTLICVNFAIFSNVDKVFEQLGFIYLGTLLLKIIVFSILFYKSVFPKETLTTVAAISLLIPTVLFLSTEAFFVIKIINKKSAKTIK